MLGGSRAYWIVTGLFCAVFVFSAVWSFVDPDGAAEEFTRLGYPDRLVYPAAVAKLLGVAAILWHRSRALTHFAFAGFLFDLLFALDGHFAEGETKVVLPAVVLVLWVAAFLADQRRFGAAGEGLPFGDGRGSDAIGTRSSDLRETRR